jgi:hypothetical protein
MTDADSNTCILCFTGSHHHNDCACACVGIQAAEFEAKDFQLRQLVDAAWSLASAAHWSPQLSSIAAAVVVHGGLRCLSSFQCTSLLWSLAILDHSYPILFRDAEPFNAGVC